MMKFMKTFGTHYSIKTQLGAMLIFEERFTSRSTDSKQSTSRKECSKWAANGCIGGGASGEVSGLFEFESSTKACAGYSSGKCSGSDYDSSWGDQNSLSRTTSRTVGSYPSDLNDWSNYLSQKENQNLVVPVQRQLVLISKLFKKEWLSKNDDFGFSKDLDGDALTRLFNSTAENYCQKILGRTYAECHPDIKGCGINDNCGFNAKCINDPSSAKGYKCQQKEIVPSRPTNSPCARPAGWCHVDTYLMIDCDGDGIPDPVCSAASGALSIIYSSSGCSSVWRNAQCGRVCQRPKGWCSGKGQVYNLVDCDRDGIPDPTCYESAGAKMGVLYSSKGCRESWPNGKCERDCSDRREPVCDLSAQLHQFFSALEPKPSKCGGNRPCKTKCWEFLPPEWCSSSTQTKLNKDCDGDGILDPVCKDSGGKLAVVYSSRMCRESWPGAQCVSDPSLGKWKGMGCNGKYQCEQVCQKPGGWCRGSTQTYLVMDCDADGIPDPVCSDANGSMGVVYSSQGCRQTWPNARCTVKM